MTSNQKLKYMTHLNSFYLLINLIQYFKIRDFIYLIELLLNKDQYIIASLYKKIKY